jgi:hypothetical protein
MEALSLLAAATVSVGLFVAALSLLEPGMRRLAKPALVAAAFAALAIVVLGVTGRLEL